MPDPDTIRSILERIRDGNDHADKHDNACTHCWTQREAVAAIDLLDNADRFYLPEHAKPGVTTSFTAFGLDPREVHAHAKYYAVRAIPDPEAAPDE